jgi:NADPH-dependent curcumin reductase CurA
MDHLGLFGASGMTAYFGMFDIGNLKDGDNVVISGAAGSVGLVRLLTSAVKATELSLTSRLLLRSRFRTPSAK